MDVAKDETDDAKETIKSPNCHQRPQVAVVGPIEYFGMTFMLLVLCPLNCIHGNILEQSHNNYDGKHDMQD